MCCDTHNSHMDTIFTLHGIHWLVFRTEIIFCSLRTRTESLYIIYILIRAFSTAEVRVRSRASPCSNCNVHGTETGSALSTSILLRRYHTAGARYYSD